MIQHYPSISKKLCNFLIYTVGSGSGSADYLVFLDLGSLANVFSNIDDGTRLINLPSSFHIGNLNFLTSYVRFSDYVVMIIFVFTLSFR